MDENTQPEGNSDELIMQQQRQIEKEVTCSPLVFASVALCLFVFFPTCRNMRHRSIFSDAADVLLFEPNLIFAFH